MVGSISIVAQTDGVRLLYWVTGSNGERSSINDFVSFSYTRPGSAAGGNGSCASSVGAAAAGYLVADIFDAGNALA